MTMLPNPPPPALELDWDDLRVFLAVGRSGGLSQAARSLKLDHSTVGRRVYRLEKVLGEKLFERDKAGLVLTTSGNRVLEESHKIGNLVDLLLIASEQARADALHTVRIGLREGLATLHIAPVLTAIRELSPEVRLEIAHAAQFVTFARREADLFLSLSPIDVPGLYSEPIGQCQFGLFASAGYLKRRGVPASIEDLAEHDFVDCLPELTPPPLCTILGHLVPSPRVVVRSVTTLGQMQAALSHCGILAFSKKAAAFDGRLVAVLPEAVGTSLTVWLSRHEQLRERRAIKAVVAQLREMWRQECTGEKSKD